MALWVLSIRDANILRQLLDAVFNRDALQTGGDLFLRPDVAVDPYPGLPRNFLKDLRKRRIVGVNRQRTVHNIYLKRARWAGLRLFLLFGG